jgi:hypothetical protein
MYSVLFYWIKSTRNIIGTYHKISMKDKIQIYGRIWIWTSITAKYGAFYLMWTYSVYNVMEVVCCQILLREILLTSASIDYTVPCTKKILFFCCSQKALRAIFIIYRIKKKLGSCASINIHCCWAAPFLIGSGSGKKCWPG